MRNDISDGICEFPFQSQAKMVNALHPDADSKSNLYKVMSLIGVGAFGRVYEINMDNSPDKFAMKRVLQDAKYQNRELSMMKILKHNNIINLIYFFYDMHLDNNFLNLVMPMLSTDLSKIISELTSKLRLLPLISVKLFTFQIAKALNYMHVLKICHRDIKPSNILIHTDTGVLKIGDLGSAKKLKDNESNVSYICSRSYRAPELLFGSKLYSTSIDLWSFGCVFAEMLLGKTIFSGANQIGQIKEIFKVLGTPSTEDLTAMNENFKYTKYPQFDKIGWSKIFGSFCPNDAFSITESLLAYNPKSRIKSINILSFKFFDELFIEDKRMVNKAPLPPELFQFNESELSAATEFTLEKLKSHSNFKIIN